MKKIWRVAARPSATVLRDPSLSEIALHLLTQRGFTRHEDIKNFLRPDYNRGIHDPFLFKDMRKVVDRVMAAIEAKEPIAIFGDYDADGVCSSALLASTLNKLGANLGQVYLPHRENEGYGLNKKAVNKFSEDGIKLLITLDCGTTNTEEILAAKRADIDVIVIDHHHVSDELSGAFALLNPKRPGEDYPYEHLASVGMAFKVTQALFSVEAKRKPNRESELASYEKWLLDLVAIATVTDMVPLTGENRILLRYGLIVLNKTRRPGLKALIDIMGGKSGQINAESIAFQIGPRLNAAGRMSHAITAYNLLMASDETEANRLANALQADNKARQQLTERITSEAREKIRADSEEYVLVVVGEGWPVGLVGLVASRLLEANHRPVLVISQQGNNFVGSGRSIPQFNIIEALHSAPDLFSKFGGHAQACGFTLRSGAEIAPLKDKLNALARQTLNEEDLSPVLNIDAEIMLGDAEWKLYETLQLFEPFGMANTCPRFLLTSLGVGAVDRCGNSQQHLKLTLTDGEGSVRPAIGFRLGEWGKSLKLGDTIDVVAEVDVNEWNGNRELQLKIIDIRTSLPK